MEKKPRANLRTPGTRRRDLGAAGQGLTETTGDTSSSVSTRHAAPRKLTQYRLATVTENKFKKRGYFSVQGTPTVFPGVQPKRVSQAPDDVPWAGWGRPVSLTEKRHHADPDQRERTGSGPGPHRAAASLGPHTHPNFCPARSTFLAAASEAQAPLPGRLPPDRRALGRRRDAGGVRAAGAPVPAPPARGAFLLLRRGCLFLRAL